MTVNIIDTAYHKSTFPAGNIYTGPGTLIGNPRQPASVDSEVWGYFTSNGNATQINLGFTPRKVRVINSTDGIIWEWLYGMPAANSIKTTLGGSFAGVVDTTSQITVSGDTPGTGGNCQVLLGVTMNGTGKLISYEVEG